MFKHICFALAFSLFAIGPCFAHAKLQSSSPPNNGQLAQAPKSLTLNFDEAAQIAMLKLVSDGKVIVIPVDKTTAPAQVCTLPLPALAPGKYTVQWTVVAADGHISKGSFAFSIAS